VNIYEVSEARGNMLRDIDDRRLDTRRYLNREDGVCSEVERLVLIGKRGWSAL